MKIIFLKDVPRVGKKNDIKEVNDGYAMNFLFPNKMAEMATTKNVSILEIKQKQIKVEREVREDLLLKNLEELKDKIVTLNKKADDKGHLFSQVHKKDIIEGLKGEHHAQISEEFIILKKPIKEIGEFEILVSINNKKSSFKLKVEKI